MSERTWKFTDSHVLWKADREPADGELVYLLDRRYSNVILGIIKESVNYDGGRSGIVFYKVYDLGPVSSYKGELRVPTFDISTLNHEREYRPVSPSFEVFPRTPETDSLIPVIVGLRRLYDEAKSDHKKLEESLARIFGDTVERAKAAPSLQVVGSERCP